MVKMCIIEEYLLKYYFESNLYNINDAINTYYMQTKNLHTTNYYI